MLVGAALLLVAPAAQAMKDAHIISFGGHGSTEGVFLRGRAHSGKPSSGAKGRGKLRKLASTAHAFVRNDLEFVKIEATHVQSGKVFQFTTDDEGFFDGHVPGPLPAGAATFRVRIADPGYRSDPVEMRVPVVDSAQAGLVVICDIDDTIADTGVTGSKITLVKKVATSNAEDMKAFPGAASTLAAFAQSGTPVVYLTAGPVELAPRIAEFLRLRGFPEGALFMRKYEDDGIGSPLAFKRARVDRLLADYPARKVIFFGDNGEEDIMLFRQVGTDTGRVTAAYVRTTLRVDPADPKLKGLVPFASWAEVARHAGRLGFIRWMRAQKVAMER